MKKFDAVRISLPLKKKFMVAKGGAEISKTNFLLVMNNRYIGEAAGSVHYGPTLDQIEADLYKGIGYLEHEPEITVDTLEAISKYDINSIARSALSGMVLHYLSGETHRYPWEVLCVPNPVSLKSSITIGIDDPKEMVTAIKQSEYPIVKIKMGNNDDVVVLEGIGDVINKDIRIDANGGWDCAKAEEMIFHLSQKGIFIIEQPTGIEHIKEWKHLKGKNENVQLIVDEGLNSFEDYEKIAPYVDGINIKMEKCGGVMEAIRLADQANEDGKAVMLGCMVASSVGMAQAIYISALADYHDLDGPLLLQDDIARGISYDRESIEVVGDDLIGGPKLKRDVVEKYIQ